MMLYWTDAVIQSRDCQKEAWKYHKAICSTHGDAHAILENFLPNDNSSPLFLALREKLDMKAAIKEWFQHHRVVLNWTCFNAFDLRHHPEQSTTHVMLTQLE